MRRFLAIVITLSLGVAGAFDVPGDASVVLTSPHGVVVGVGALERGERLSLDLLPGFRGPARLLLVAADGRVTVLEASVGDETVTVDGVDLLALLAQAGFRDLTVTGHPALETWAARLRAGDPVALPVALPGPVPPVAAPPVTVPPPGLPIDVPGPPVGPDLPRDLVDEPGDGERPALPPRLP